jgi:hypothetical protein
MGARLRGQRQRFIGQVQGSVRIAEMPVAVPDVGTAEDAHIDTVDFGVVAAVGFACFQTSLKPITCCLKGAEMKCRDPGEVVSLREQLRFADSTR